jgi:hypothetical protein
MGKARLLDQIEVFAPLLPEYHAARGDSSVGNRRASRLHHVRGHLVGEAVKYSGAFPIYEDGLALVSFTSER